MTEASRRLPGPQFPDLRDWIDPLGLMDLRPKLDFHPIRVEDVFEGDSYVLRAELPGIDPLQDVEIIVSDGTLTILAERSADKHDKRHTEFRRSDRPPFSGFSSQERRPPGSTHDEARCAPAHRPACPGGPPVGSKRSSTRPCPPPASPWNPRVSGGRRRDPHRDHRQERWTGVNRAVRPCHGRIAPGGL